MLGWWFSCNHKRYAVTPLLHLPYDSRWLAVIEAYPWSPVSYRHGLFSIRNYEIGYRQASRDKLELIAQRLGVPVETLIDRQIDSYNDAMHILFELSEKYDLVPVEIPQEPKYVIQTKNEVILQALEAWYNKRRK